MWAIAKTSATLFAETDKAFGKLDVLVNNAGVFEFLPLEAITDAHFHRMFDLNVLGLIAVTQEAVKRFGEKGGSIINISSIVSLSPQPSGSVYAATKGAVDALTVSFAKELAARKIRVNTIHPGLIPTEGVQAMTRPAATLRADEEADGGYTARPAGDA